MRWSDAPIVTLSRGGQAIELGRTGQDDVLHLHGSTGLGLAPWSVAKSDRIGGDGSIVRGGRYGDREVFLPVWIGGDSVGDLTGRRRELYRLLAPHLGPVTVRVQDPVTGTDRSIEGVLKDGLEGDFGDTFHGVWQTLGLTFDCPDPWWMGEQHLQELQVAPGSKPFISDSVPFFPVVLAGSIVQGIFGVHVEGDAPVRPVWQVMGPGTDLIIASGGSQISVSGSFAAGEVVTFDGRDGSITPDIWDRVSDDTELFELAPGMNRVQVTMVGASTASIVRLVYRERFLEAI